MPLSRAHRKVGTVHRSGRFGVTRRAFDLRPQNPGGRLQWIVYLTWPKNKARTETLGICYTATSPPPKWLFWVKSSRQVGSSLQNIASHCHAA